MLFIREEMTEWLKVIDCKSIEYYSSQVRILFSSFLIDKHFWLCIRLQILLNEFEPHINLELIYERYNKIPVIGILFYMLIIGVEPTPYLKEQILSLSRLPIPPNKQKI